MATTSLLISTLPVANPLDLNPVNTPQLTGWLRHGTGAAKTDGTYLACATAPQMCLYWDTEPPGNIVRASLSVKLLSVGSSRHGPFFINKTTGIGFQMWLSDLSNLKISQINSSGSLAGADLKVVTLGAPLSSAVSNYTLDMWYNKADGTLQMGVDGVPQGTVYAAGAIPNLRAGGYTFSSTITRGMTAINVEYTPTYSVTSFNGVNPIERGQINAVFATAGMTTIASITTNRPGLSAGGIVSDVAGNGHADISDFQDGAPFPALPTEAITTFTDTLGHSGQITKTYIKKATDTLLNVSGAITVNDEFFLYHMQADGRSIADGCQINHPTTPGFVMNADGSYTADETVTLEVWYRDIGNGNMYGYLSTFTKEGTIIIDGSLRNQSIAAIPLQSASLRSISL